VRPRFAFLGTAGALATAGRDNTSIVFEADGMAVLADVGGGAVQRLRRLGIDPLALTHVVVTHVHVDHAYGLPSLIRQSMLLGRQAPLTIVCRPEHVDALRTLLTVFRLWERPGAFPLVLTAIDLAVGATVSGDGPLRVRTAPNEHGAMPNFAIRVEAAAAGAVVYSSDTKPCETVVLLARGAHTLVHDATYLARDRAVGRAGHHSTAGEAAEVAARAGVRRLILTHLGPEYHDDTDRVLAEARGRFGGTVEVAGELASYEF
jgi:ribonuclease Z